MVARLFSSAGESVLFNYAFLAGRVLSGFIPGFQESFPLFNKSVLLVLGKNFTSLEVGKP